MNELYKYVCPSCGANLDPTQGEKVISCPFCGSVFDRTGVLNAYDRKSSEKLAKTVSKYKEDLMTYNGLEAKVLRLADEVTELTKKNTELPMWTAMVMPVFIVLCAVLLIMLIAFKDKVGITAAVVVFIAAGAGLIAASFRKSKLKREADDVRQRLKVKLSELNSARSELEQFGQSFDIDAIPKTYRSCEALDYLIGLFGSYQASRLGDAFKMYDEHIHFKKMEALQSEQVAIQKRQLEIMDELADYDFDDTYDDDDFRLHDTLKAFRENNMYQ